MYFNQKRVNLLNDGVSGVVCFLRESDGLSSGGITICEGNRLGSASLVALYGNGSISVNSLVRSNSDFNILAKRNRRSLNCYSIGDITNLLSSSTRQNSSVGNLLHLVVYVNEDSIQILAVYSINNINVLGIVAVDRLVCQSDLAAFNTLGVLGVNVDNLRILVINAKSGVAGGVNLIAVDCSYCIVATNIILDVFDFSIAYNIVLDKFALVSALGGLILKYGDGLRTGPDLVLPYLVAVSIGNTYRSSGYEAVGIVRCGRNRSSIVNDRNYLKSL